MGFSLLVALEDYRALYLNTGRAFPAMVLRTGNLNFDRLFPGAQSLKFGAKSLAKFKKFFESRPARVENFLANGGHHLFDVSQSIGRAGPTAYVLQLPIG